MKKTVLLLIMLVATISMWAQQIDSDDIRFDFDRQSEQAGLQRPEFITPITRSEATPAGGLAPENRSPDKIRWIAPREQAASGEGDTPLGYVTKDKLRYAIFQSSEVPTQVATLIGWVDSYDYFPNIVVPDEVTYKGKSVPVTTISDYCFYDGWGITGLTIGKNVTDIGAYAFYGCSITALSIPDCVTAIRQEAFRLCPLTSIVFENPSDFSSALIIGAAAFASTDIKSIEIPARIKLYDDCSFRKARWNIFEGCKNLETITINPRFDEVMKRNFTLEINQGALCERTFPNDTYPEYLVVIAYPAARPCQEFSLTAPVIDAFTGAFSNSKINKITLTATSEPRTVNEKASVNMCIDYNAFDYSDITELNLSANGPATLRAPFSLFCYNLPEFNLSESITNLKIIDGALCAEKDGKSYLLSYPAGRTVTQYIVPDIILHLADQCFKSNIFVKEIILPTGLKSIGNESFSHCENLERLIYKGNNLESIGYDAFALTKVLSSAPPGEVALGNWLIGYSGEMPSNLVISENITHSLPEIFRYNINITSVTFPQNFENIPNGMFYECRKLNTVQLPKKLKTIGAYAFMYAGYDATQENSRSGEMRTLTIPEGVKEIGYSAFDCSRLGDKLLLPSSLELLGEFSLGGFYSEVEIHRSTPPENPNDISRIFLPGTLSNATLIIPKDADPLTFTQNPLWNFSKVINGNFSSISDVVIKKGKISVSTGTISSDNGEIFTLYTMDGRAIGKGSSFSNLNPGIYIVRLGTDVQKYVIM